MLQLELHVPLERNSYQGNIFYSSRNFNTCCFLCSCNIFTRGGIFNGRTIFHCVSRYKLSKKQKTNFVWWPCYATKPPQKYDDKKAYTFFQFYSDRGQRQFWLKIFLYTFFAIYFPINLQPTCLKIIFLRCVRAKISWHDQKHRELEDSMGDHHHHLAVKWCGQSVRLYPAPPCHTPGNKSHHGQAPHDESLSTTWSCSVSCRWIAVACVSSVEDES